MPLQTLTQSKWLEVILTFTGSIIASAVIMSSMFGSYREKVDRHDRELPELRGQLAATQNLVAAHTATLQSIDQKIDLVLSNQRAADDRLDRALDGRLRR